MTNQEIAELLYHRVCGTTDDLMQVIDQMIEDREITIEQYRQNEMSILGMVDDRMFNCESCGWNIDINEMSDEDMKCCDCGEFYD